MYKYIQVKREAYDEMVEENRRLRAEHSNTLKLYETIEAWVTKLDNDGAIMDEPPWYCNLIIEIAFLKGEM